MRNALTAVFTTAGSEFKSRTKNSADVINNSDTMAMNTALYLAVFHTDCSARSGCLAPRFCPTNVAAALLSPHAGIIKKISKRMAMV